MGTTEDPVKTHAIRLANPPEPRENAAKRYFNAFNARRPVGVTSVRATFT